ncbi:MAG: hypothetical protein KDB82_02230 [Planctomycetes bacterium]|nr:hypothetical protein [Planctomycetota bacterium]
MSRWILSAICLTAAFALAACGNGNTATNAPQTNTGSVGNTAADNTAKSNKPDGGPKEDPNKWRNVEAVRPDGWDTLEKYGLTELVNTKELKKAPAGTTYLDGITRPKPPGATEQDEEPWTQWREQVSAAALFHVGDSGDALKALQDNGGKFVDGFDASLASMNGSVATAKVDGGKHILAAVSNENGTYLIVGVIMKEENRTEHERVIVKWAGSLKTK